MSDNVLQTLQQLVQDVIAPDVRELKVRLTSLEKQIDVRFTAVDGRFTSVDSRFDALEQKLDARFDALMSAISESRAQAELTNMRVIAAPSERVAVLEAQRH
jgi:flagellar capping protein FliD